MKFWNGRMERFSSPAVPFCAYDKSALSPQVSEKIWRPRRDLNPCYRRERAMS
jgi:hypothetical protein